MWFKDVEVETPNEFTTEMLVFYPMLSRQYYDSVCIEVLELQIFWTNTPTPFLLNYCLLLLFLFSPFLARTNPKNVAVAPITKVAK